MLKRRTRRQPSNIFHMLGKNQIVELREAFNIIDTNSDGSVTRADLDEFLNSIGTPFTEKEVDAMMEEMGNNMSFMTFITMIGERLSSTDPEKDILKALLEFDDNGDSKIEEKTFRKWLTEEEDRLSDSDVDILLRGCVENGKIDCNLLTTKMKYGEIIRE